MAKVYIDIKVKIDEEKKDAYLADLIKQIESGEIDEDEAIALIQVDYRQFVKVEVNK